MNDFITVFQAELLRRVRSRPFLIGLVLGMVFIAIGTQLPAWMTKATAGATHDVIVVGNAPLAPRAAKLLARDFKVVAIVPTQTPDAALLAAHHAATAIQVARATSGMQINVYTKDPGNVAIHTMRRDLVPLELQLNTRLAPKTIAALLTLPIGVHPVSSSKFASSAQSDAAHGIASMLIFFLYLLILLNSQLLMSSVAEEKTSRIAELLVASVDPIALLAGKIASTVVLAFVQLAVWVAAVFVLGSQGHAAHAAGSPFDLSGLLSGSIISPGVIVAFVLFFLIGLLQLSTLFAALASLINRTEDIGSVAMPLVFPVVAALLVAITALDVPDASWVVGISFVPILAPFVMFARIAVSDVPIWQVVLSLAINLVALGLIAILAGKIYRVGMLLYGRSPNLAQIWSVVRS